MVKKVTPKGKSTRGLILEEAFKLFMSKPYELVTVSAGSRFWHPRPAHQS